MAALNVPTSDLLSRLAAGTAGVVGGAFLRRLVEELAAALGAEVAFVAELVDERPGRARLIAVSAEPGYETNEGLDFALAGTPCEHVYAIELMQVPEGAQARYPDDPWLAKHDLTGYVAIVLRGAGGRAIGHVAIVSSRRLELTGAELDALRIFAARAGAEVERRRHEATLRRRTEDLAASREDALRAADEERRRIGRDLHDGAQQRLVVLGQALDLALRDMENDPEGAAKRLACAREQAALAGRELRELARGLHPVGLERGLAGALAGLAVQSPIPLHVAALPARRLPPVVEATIWFIVSEALSNAIKHADATNVRVEVVQHGRTLVAEVVDDGRGGARVDGGTGIQGLAARVESLGGRLIVDSPPDDGTRLAATIPLAPWRTARDPFLEFGHEGDGGQGRRKIDEILEGRRTSGVSLAREWDLEGGPPRIGQRLPVLDHTGRRYAVVEVERVALVPFGEVDASTVSPEPGYDDWHEGRRAAFDAAREELAALFGEPDWRLTDNEPMVILWYRKVE